MAKCAQCGGDGAGQDSICGGCRLRAFAAAKRKYEWTEELRRELREAYQLPKMPRAKAIERIARRTGWPHKAFTAEAVRMGITTWRRKVWTAEEDAQLREWAGSLSWSTIGRRMGRSQGSVMARSDFLQLSRRPCEGYTREMLENVFGVRGASIRRWIERGLFGNLRNDRVTEQGVLRFIRNYPHEYDLRRVDQTWYKSMLFGEMSEVA